MKRQLVRLLAFTLAAAIAALASGCRFFPFKLREAVGAASSDGGSAFEADRAVKKSVPDLRGRYLGSVTSDREYNGYFVFYEQRREWSDVYAEGQIISQSPAPGTLVDARSYPVYLTISRGHNEADDYVDVPEMKGMNVDEATRILKSMGLDVDIWWEYSVEPGNTIIFSTADRYKKGDTVILSVSNGRFRVRYVNYTFEVPERFAGSEHLDIDVAIIGDASGCIDYYILELRDVSYESVKSGVPVTFDAAGFDPFESDEYQKWRLYINDERISSGWVWYYDGTIHFD